MILVHDKQIMKLNYFFYAYDYVSLNKLGMHFDQHTLSEGLQKLIEDPNQLNYNKNFSVNEFSYEEMTEKLTSFFI